MPELRIGQVTDFFAKPVVAGVKLEDTVKLGDSIHIKGHTTDMEIVVKSMQIDGVDITEGKPGDTIGLMVADRVRHGDIIYKITA
jgi:selenocysteine-specific translation elongation factor